MTTTPTRIRQACGRVAVALLLVALSACSADTAPARPPSRQHSQRRPRPRACVRAGVVDELVEVDGAHLHARCTGAGDTTIVLIAGFGDGGESWEFGHAEPVSRAPVCTYDRFGLGASDQPPTVQTFSSEAADLHALLTTMGEVGPYVVVGHSFGGAEAVAFARLPGPSPRPGAHGCRSHELDPHAVRRARRRLRRPPVGPSRSAPLSRTRRTTPSASTDFGPSLRSTVSPLSATCRWSSSPLPSTGYPASTSPRTPVSMPSGPTAKTPGRGFLQRQRSCEVPDTGHYIQVDQPQTVIEQIRSLLA